MSPNKFRRVLHKDEDIYYAGMVHHSKSTSFGLQRNMLWHSFEFTFAHKNSTFASMLWSECMGNFRVWKRNQSPPQQKPEIPIFSTPCAFNSLMRFFVSSMLASWDGNRVQKHHIFNNPSQTNTLPKILHCKASCHCMVRISARCSNHRKLGLANFVSRPFNKFPFFSQQELAQWVKRISSRFESWKKRIAVKYWLEDLDPQRNGSRSLALQRYNQL